MKKMRIPVLLAALTLLTGCGTEPETPSAPDSSEPEVTATEPAETEPADTTAAPAADSGEVPELKGYSLLWNDEFDSSALDETIWNYEPHEPGWRMV